MRDRSAGALWVTVVVAALTLTGCGSGPKAPTGSPSGQRPTAPDDLETVILLDFETAEVPFVEGSRIRSAGSRPTDGVVHLAGPSPQPPTEVTGRSGRAVAFPAPCPPAGAATCPKAVIEIALVPDLVPGDDDFGFGASVLLEPDQTSKGSNVVQKGFSRGGGSQWKLQIDGVEGRPSCVMVGLDDSTIYQARSHITVADGGWHDVACRRSGDQLSIRVDGVQRAVAAIPPALVIEPPGPVLVAGKNLKPDNDQYFGALDDVYIEAVAG